MLRPEPCRIASANLFHQAHTAVLTRPVRDCALSELMTRRRYSAHRQVASAPLLQVVYFDQGHAGGAVLTRHDGGVAARGQPRENRRL